MALEIVKQLEEQKEICELVMIDGSPDFIKQISKEFTGDCKTETERFRTAVAYFSSLLGGPLLYKEVFIHFIVRFNSVLNSGFNVFFLIFFRFWKS